jgi:hypothetical protein
MSLGIQAGHTYVLLSMPELVARPGQRLSKRRSDPAAEVTAVAHKVDGYDW